MKWLDRIFLGIIIIGLTLALVALCTPARAQDSTNVTVSWNPNTEADLKQYWVNVGFDPKDSLAFSKVFPTTATALELAVSGVSWFAVEAEDAAGQMSGWEGVTRFPPIEVQAVVDTVTDSELLEYVVAGLFKDTQGLDIEPDSVTVEWQTNAWYVLKPENEDVFWLNDTLVVNIPRLVQFLPANQETLEYNYQPVFRVTSYHQGHSVSAESNPVYIKPPEVGIPEQIQLRRLVR